MEDERQKAETFLKSLSDLLQKICRLWPPGVVFVSAELRKHLDELNDGLNLFLGLPRSWIEEYRRKAGEVLINSGLIAVLCKKATPWFEDKQGGCVTKVIWALCVCMGLTAILLKKVGDLHRLLPLMVDLLKESFLDHTAGTLQEDGDDTLIDSLGVLCGLARVEENKQHLRDLPNIQSVLRAYSRSENEWMYHNAVTTLALVETERRADISSPNHGVVQFLLGQLKALEREGFNTHDLKLLGVFEAACTLTYNPGNSELLVQEGVLPYLEKGLVKCVSENKCKERETLIDIVLTLQNLACEKRNKAEIMKHKQLLDSLVSISIDQSHSHHPVCIEGAKDALSNLGMNPQDLQNDGTRRTGSLDIAAPDNHMSNETKDSERLISIPAPQRMDSTNDGLTSSLPNGSPNLSSGVQFGNIPHSGSTCSMQPGNSGKHTPSSTASPRPSSADSNSMKDSSDDEPSRSSSPVTVQRVSRTRRRTPYSRTPSPRVPLAQRNTSKLLQPLDESVTMKNPLGGEVSKTSHPSSLHQRCNSQGRIFRPLATVSRGTSTAPCTHPSPAFSTTAPVPPIFSLSAGGFTVCLYPEGSQPRTSGSSHHRSDREQLIYSNESQPSEYRHPPLTISYLPRSSGKQQRGRSPDPDENFNDFQPLSQQNPGLQSHVPEHQAFSSCRSPQDPGLSPMGQGSFSSGPRQRRKWASDVKTEGLQNPSQTSASLSRANEMTCEQYLLCPECGLSYTSQNDSHKGRGKRRNQSKCPDCQPSRKYPSSVKKHKSHSIAERKHGNDLPSKTCGLSSESKHSTYSPKATVMSAEYKPCIASGTFRNSDSSARPFSKAKTKHSKHSPSRRLCGPAVSCHEIPSKSSGMNIPKMPLVKAENSPQTSKQFLKTETNESTIFQHQECIASNKPWTENACTKQQKDTRVKRKCPHCSEAFVSADEFLLHMKHKRHFKCRECVKCFAYKKTLAKHVKDKHDPENESSYKCMVCDKEFGCERYMKEHEKVHGEHAYERYKCMKCEKGFPYRSIFNKHIKLCR